MEQELDLTYHSSLESLAKVCEVVTLNCPLHPETEHMINEESLKWFKRGAYLVNTARGKLADRDAIVAALENGQLAGYAAGTCEILECYFEGRPIRDEYLIVQGGQLAGVGAHSYSKGNATGGSEEAAKFKKS